MAMTRKDFAVLAEAIREHNGKATIGSSTFRQAFTQDQLETLAEFLSWQNPSFNRQRWLDSIADEF